jgi:hypothetical protein
MGGKPLELTYKMMLEEKEAELLEQMMPYYQSALEMAKDLKMDKSTLNRKISKFKIKTPW